MKGIVLATFASVAFWTTAVFAWSVSQHAEVAARVCALILLPCAVVAVQTARKAGR
jgi:hypothetical protein